MEFTKLSESELAKQMHEIATISCKTGRHNEGVTLAELFTEKSNVTFQKIAINITPDEFAELEKRGADCRAEIKSHPMYPFYKAVKCTLDALKARESLSQEDYEKIK